MAKTLRKPYDLIVVGGDPAGTTAALRASRQKATVLIIKTEESSRPGLSIGWLGPAGVGLCKECGLGMKKAGAADLKGVRLHSWDLRRSTFANDRELRGWLVERKPGWLKSSLWLPRTMQN